jgi:hypothetical protein
MLGLAHFLAQVVAGDFREVRRAPRRDSRERLTNRPSVLASASLAAHSPGTRALPRCDVISTESHGCG